MSDDIGFGRHLKGYLAIRDALGLAAGTRAHLLRSFLDYARGVTAPGMPIRATTAVAWAGDHAPPGCGDAGKAHRLMVARGFLAYLSAVVPGTEVPPYGLLASHRRRRPYIFSPPRRAKWIWGFSAEGSNPICLCLGASVMLLFDGPTGRVARSGIAAVGK